MKKRIWDLYAPVYGLAMKADRRIYAFMYERIPEKIRGREVLEIATGPGLLAKHVAPAAKEADPGQVLGVSGPERTAIHNIWIFGSSVKRYALRCCRFSSGQKEAGRKTQKIFRKRAENHTVSLDLRFEKR